ncbi:hypothetical protein T492DRAFT_1002419 [Pavlovales sp. CCMP2436]|nr:hypothetical protein T492DRAFT_1002419 [Pavlovales sp. CCMP2436]
MGGVDNPPRTFENDGWALVVAQLSRPALQLLPPPMPGPRRRLLLTVIAGASTASAVGAHSCGVGDWCSDVSSWCPARNCGAFLLDGVDGMTAGWAKSADAQTCKGIRHANPRQMDGGGSQVYCVSLDVSMCGFQCFGGESWLANMLAFLQLVPESVDDEYINLNRTNCESLALDSPYSGTVYLSGKCCTGGAVPCSTGGACTRGGFRPLGPSVLSSPVSIILIVCAIIHIISALQCIAFADRLINGIRSVKTMGSEDKNTFKTMISTLGAAHGGFAAILCFGALQDWLYGKSQITLAAITWYGFLGPVAEAMQRSDRQGGSLDGGMYLSMWISASKAECGGEVPKLNYVLLCVLLLVSIGVEGLGFYFFTACGMVAAGLVTSLIVSRVVAISDDEGSGSELMR